MTPSIRAKSKCLLAYGYYISVLFVFVSLVGRISLRTYDFGVLQKIFDMDTSFIPRSYLERVYYDVPDNVGFILLYSQP